MSGRLVVCPTPIGNLDDISRRVSRALHTVDVIACEDTRRTGLLLERLEIPRPVLVSYHEHNESRRADELARRIERGERVALVSDAGMPVISDPGFRLVAAAIDRGLEIEVLPGPSAVVTALVASGLPPDRWRFEGYLPRRPGELERVLSHEETVVAFESPRRLPATLAALAAMAPDRPAAVCRELTKLHEEIARGTLDELAHHFRGEVRGEIVVVLGGGRTGGRARADAQMAADAARRLVQSGARPRVAATVVSTLTGVRANALYSAITGRAPREP